MAARKSKHEQTNDPDKLVRESPGIYRSGDGRFEVRQAATGWYVVDTERTNELGQELIHGPFAAMKDARAELPGARALTPLPHARLAAAPPKPARPAPPPKSWIDRLPDDEAASVQRLIRALERERIAGAEDLVRESRRTGGASGLGQRLIERKLDALIEEADAADRARERALVRRVLNILTEDGATQPSPLPRWALVQIDGEAPPDRLRPKV